MKTLKEIRKKWEGGRKVLGVIVRQEDNCDYQTVFSIVDDNFGNVSVFRYFKLNGESWECSADYRGRWINAIQVVGSNFNDQLQSIAKKDNAKETK